jgi:threonine/homoserine/homoserine lactone efflux protein
MEDAFILDQISVFFRGLILGVVIAAPVGPVGLLCIKRTLQRGLLAGLVTGGGAATADAIYGAVAAFGVTAALGLLSGLEAEIRLIGGAILMIHSIVALTKKVTINREGEPSTLNLIGAYFSSFFFTVSNPLMLGAMAVVAAFAGSLSYWQAATLTGGIFCGSLLWWLFLSGGTYLVRKHFSDHAITWINRGAAILLVILASWALYTGVAAKMGYPIIGPHLQKQFALEPIKP